MVDSLTTALYFQWEIRRLKVDRVASRFLLRSLEREKHRNADAESEPPVIEQQAEDEDKSDSDREC